MTMVKVGSFSIDPAQSNWSTVGSASLTTGFLGELIAQITVLASDGEWRNQYWLHADVLDKRIEYLFYSDVEGAVVRDGSWLMPGGFEENDEFFPGDEESMVEGFTAMASLATGLDIKPLEVGVANDFFGVMDEETLVGLTPLWTPTPS